MIRVIVCGYECEATLPKCLDSIQMQQYADFDIYVSIEEDEGRKYLLKNTVDTIQDIKPADRDIIVLVDADDFLCDEMALGRVAATYRFPDTYLTYGSYINLSTCQKGKFNGPYMPEDSFRTSPWRASHLKTFKYELLKKVPVDQFKDDSGNWFTCCADRALMVPMMELAGHDRIQHLPLITYCYNDTNPISVWNTKRVLSKATRAVICGRTPLLRKESI